MSDQETTGTEEQSEQKMEDLEVSEEQSEDVKGGGFHGNRPDEGAPLGS